MTANKACDTSESGNCSRLTDLLLTAQLPLTHLQSPYYSLSVLLVLKQTHKPVTLLLANTFPVISVVENELIGYFLASLDVCSKD